jgi:hypothetical protein
MAGTYDSLVATLELDLEALGDMWDQPCNLSFIYYDEETWHLSELPLPEMLWQPHPAAGLERMAAGVANLISQPGDIRDAIKEMKPDTWRGVAFFSESWVVEQCKSPEAEMDPVFEEMAKARMLSQHPAREEARCWWARLADGTNVTVMLKRSGDLTHSVFEPGASDGPKPEFVGKIPWSLEVLAEALANA